MVKQFLWSGGLGIPLFSEKTCNELENFLTTTTPLVPLMITQRTSLTNADKVKEAIKVAKQKKERTTYQQVIKDWSKPGSRYKKEKAKEKRVSSWLIVLPMGERPFTLNKIWI